MKRWFGPRKFGWGARPVTWQGWLSVAVYVGLLVLVTRFLDIDTDARWTAIGLSTGALLALVYFTYKKE